MIPEENLTFLWDNVINPRLGNDYVWGGSFSEDPEDGTDCSGSVTPELTALAYGPDGIIWQRQFYTGTFAGAEPGDKGPFGGVDCTRDLICIARPTDAPFGAAMIIAIRQMPDPTDAHMIISVPKFVGGPWTTVEMGGPPNNYHLGYTAIDNPQFNQWFYLPGPIGKGGPVVLGTPLVEALRAKGFSPKLIRLVQGFSIVEGLNPAGNPTLGWTDAQLGGDSSLQGHVDALAQQFIDREYVAGKFPEMGTDWEQAKWIAKVVGQEGLSSDWQGNPQPTDYVQRVVNAMQEFNNLVDAPGGDMFDDDARNKLNEIYNVLFAKTASHSRYADPKDTWTIVDYIRNDDGFAFDVITEHDAALGDTTALARIEKAAADGDILAQHFLDKLSSTPAKAIPAVENSVGSLPNNFKCWNCSKNYPDVLEKCPFCGSGKFAPKTADPQPLQPAQTAQTAQPAQTPTAQPTLAALDIPAPTAGNGSKIKEVINQLTVLQQFSQELPTEIAESIKDLIPILKNWEGQKK